MSAAMVGRALPPLPGQKPSSGSVQPVQPVDFFLPTGIMVSFPVSPQCSLREIKVQLFNEARKYPLFSLLKDQGFYNFLG